MEKLECDKCRGVGFTSEHDTHPHPDGDCCGACPVAVQCEYCEATGYLTGEILLRRERQRIDSEKFKAMDLNSNLPF